MNTELNKTQKALCLFGALYLAYGVMFMGETFGLEDSGQKFLGKKSGKIQNSMAQWAGIGCLTLALDCFFVALHCSAEVGQRTVLGNAIAAFTRLGIFCSQGSINWGGTLVHKEFLQGGILTLLILFLAVDCVRTFGITSSKHFIFGCKDLTHACLLGTFFMYFAYLMMFIFTDFISDQYICPGRAGPLACRKAEPMAYNQLAWTWSMWMSVAYQIPQMIMVGSAAEQKQFALARLITVAACVWQMKREAAITIPAKMSEGYAVQGLGAALLLVAVFSEQILGLVGKAPKASKKKSK